MMLESMFKVLLKIIKNKKFTKFMAVITLLVITFMLSNTESSLVQTVVYLSKYSIVRILLLLVASFLLCNNIQLGLLFIISIGIVMNIPYNEPETFSNIPNMIDKESIIKYNKNFKEPKDFKDTKNENEELEDKNEENQKEQQENKKKRRKTGFAISEDLYHEKRGSNLDNKEKNNVEEINLDDDEDDTIEKELKKKNTNDLRKLEEYDSSSTESSNSESSDSSTDSSDSEKEIEEVSMTKARDHMLKKLRNGLKKRYIHD